MHPLGASDTVVFTDTGQKAHKLHKTLDRKHTSCIKQYALCTVHIEADDGNYLRTGYIWVAECIPSSVCPWTPHSDGLKELLEWNFIGLHSMRNGEL